MTSSPDRRDQLPPAIPSMWRLCKLGYQHEPGLMSVAFMLARMEQPDFPQPVGIFRAVERPTYEEMMEDQIAAAVQKSGPGNLERLLNAGETWVVD